MNIIDMYLAMNSCERDDNDVYFVDHTDRSKRELIAVISQTDITDSTLNIRMKCEKPMNFIQFNIVIED